MERAGYHVEIVFWPWARALVSAQKGYVEGLMGASYTKEREQYFVYPEYYWESAITFFARSDSGIRYSTPRELCPASIGVLNGSFLIDKLKATTCLNISLANSVEINIRKLFAGRVDLLLESSESVYYIINHSDEFRNRKDRVMALTPPFQIDKIYIGKMILARFVSCA